MPLVSGHVHADGHEHETAENGRSTADLVRDAAQDQRSDGHAEELCRQHVTQGRLIDAPLERMPGEAKASTTRRTRPARSGRW